MSHDRHRTSQPALRTGEVGDPAGRMVGVRARCRRHQPAEAREERRHPGAQLPDAGDLPRRGRHRRRQPGARPRGHEGRCRGDRAGGRALHGRDRQAAQSRQARADPRPARRLLACRLDHRRGRAPAAPALARRAGRHLRQHLGGGEGRERHLLHLRQRQEDRREPRRAEGDHAARRVPGPEHRPRDRRRDRHLGRPLRGPRALLRRRRAPAPRRPSRRRRAGPSRMPARGRGRGRFRGLDRGDGRLRDARAAGPRRADDRMLDERQHRRPQSRTSTSCGPAISVRT